MATPCHPPSVLTTPGSSAGLADFLLDVFFYPKGKDEGSCDYCGQIFQAKGAAALWLCSSAAGFSGILLQTQQTPSETQKRERTPKDRNYLGSFGDLLAREILGDFLAAQSSLSSMSLESEQLQLSIIVEIKLFP